jgi:hypothetical protein
MACRDPARPAAGRCFRRHPILQVAKCLVLAHPLMGQLGLKRLDRRSCLLKQVLRPLARGDLIVQGLPRGGDLIDASAIIVVVVDQSDGTSPSRTKRPRWGCAVPGGADGGAVCGADAEPSHNPRARRICSSVARRRSSSAEESDIDWW